MWDQGQEAEQENAHGFLLGNRVQNVITCLHTSSRGTPCQVSSVSWCPVQEGGNNLTMCWVNTGGSLWTLSSKRSPSPALEFLTGSRKSWH